MKTGMCYWRFKGQLEWRFGYCTLERNNLYRMGRWNGDTMGGTIIDPFDVETRDY